MALEPRTAELAKKLLTVLYNDLPRIEVLDRYLHGDHDLPYMPDSADEEYMLLAERARMNWMPLIVTTPVQAMYVDGFTPSTGESANTEMNPAWDHWQRSRLDAKQASIYSGAFAYGHSFVVTERGKDGKSTTRGLSATKTAALFEDPANDITPAVALTVTRWPNLVDGKAAPGEAVMWDDKNKYLITFSSPAGDAGLKVGWKLAGRHGCQTCPVTRFAASVDLEGRTVGLIGPLKLLQDRVNQTVFDLLVAQTYGSFRVRWATGMAPPLKKRVIWLRDNDGNLVTDAEGQPQVEDIVDQLDQSGRPIPEDVNLNAKRFMFAENEDVKFGSLEGTPLDGYISSIEMSVKQLAALSQTPPHHILGQIANLSAEALEAAETSLNRKVQLFKTAFGECWERVFNLAAELDDDEGADDYAGEVIWRDMEGQGLAKYADALNKLKELDVPRQGLWEMVPGITATKLREWKRLIEEDPDQVLATAIRNAGKVQELQALPASPQQLPDATEGELIA